MVGFGQGVADPTWFGRGSCTGDMEYYSKAVKGSDILTFDIYPAASPRSNIKGKLEYIGRGLDLLMECATHDQTVWAEIETTRIYSDTMVTPAQLRAEVWMSLIHGAKGIVYFVHEWSGGFRDDGIFRHPEIVAAVTDVNRAIGALAPVINSPNVESLNVTGGAGISTMLKWQGSTLYLFAVNERPSGTVVQFKLPKFNKTMQATVLDEERSVAVSNGVFSDTFGGYGVHIYRIALAGATSP